MAPSRKKDFKMNTKKKIKNIKAKGKKISPETKKKLAETYGRFFNQYFFMGIVSCTNKASFVRYTSGWTYSLLKILRNQGARLH